MTPAAADSGASPAAGATPTAAALSPAGIPPGTVLVNTYRVERLLGGGGMGEVYLARHAKLRTRHAVKVIRASMAANRQVMELFYREARVLREVRHPAVVSYDGFVQDDQGRDYLVMEYVDGPSLAERLSRGPLPLEDVWTLRDQLTEGLAEAHRQGAIHRDISPDNIILPGDQVAAAKLIDFGLSKLTDPGEESIIGASFAGKFRFAAPEQFGMFGGEVDGRSDLYSLGLSLAAAALGRPLDMGNSFDGALRARQTVPDLTQLPAPLRPWLAAMLEPNPARRPKSMDEVRSRWPATTKITQARRSAALASRASPQSMGRRSAVGLMIGGLLTVVAAVGLYTVLRPLPRPQPAAPNPRTLVQPSAPQPGAGEPGGSVGAGTAAALPRPPPEPPLVRATTAPVVADTVREPPAPVDPAALLVKVRTLLAPFACATLSAEATSANVLTLAGHVQSEADRDRLGAAVAAVWPQPVNLDRVAVIGPPFCAAVKIIKATAASRNDALAPGIALNHDNGIYRDYDPLTISVRSLAGQPGRLLLTGIDSDGRVDHLIPSSMQKSDRIAGTGQRRVDVSAGPPFGRNMMLAVWCPGQLFAPARGDTEPLNDFLRDLQSALGRANPPCALSYRFWDTQPR